MLLHVRPLLLACGRTGRSPPAASRKSPGAERMNHCLTLGTRVSSVLRPQAAAHMNCGALEVFAQPVPGSQAEEHMTQHAQAPLVPALWAEAHRSSSTEEYMAQDAPAPLVPALWAEAHRSRSTEEYMAQDAPTPLVPALWAEARRSHSTEEHMAQASLVLILWAEAHRSRSKEAHSLLAIAPSV